MCKRPVTLGGGITAEKLGLEGLISGRLKIEEYLLNKSSSILLKSNLVSKIIYQILVVSSSITIIRAT